MIKNKEIIVMAMLGGLFLVTSLILTAYRSSLALGRVELSPLSTPTVWPEWLPLPATDIWSVPPRPATLVPAESRPRPTLPPASPLLTPTPLPDRGIGVTGVRALSGRAESGIQPLWHLRFISPATDGETLVGITESNTGVLLVVMLDLASGDERVLFESERRDIYDPQVVGKYVVWWATGGNLYVYNLEQKQLETLRFGTIARHVRLSGNTMVWEHTPHSLSAEQDIWGYDLSKRESFSVVSRPGVQSGPLISERWVLYLDSTDTQAADWDEGLYAIHLDTGETIRLGQVYGRWPHEVLQFYTLDVPWAAWSTGHWSDKPELYLYNLETRQAMTVTVAPCDASTAQPRRVENLAISGNVVIFTCGQPMGYDIDRREFFSVPVYAMMPADGKWWGLEGWSIAGDRIVWVLSSEQESRVYTAQIERRP